MGMGSPLKRSSTIFALMVESVTIVLPCRNEETRIEACLDSLLGFTDLEAEGNGEGVDCPANPV